MNSWLLMVSAPPCINMRESGESLSNDKRSKRWVLAPPAKLVLSLWRLMSWRGLAGGRQPHELPLHRIDLREVISDVMVAAPLVGGQPEAAPCIGLASPGAA